MNYFVFTPQHSTSIIYCPYPSNKRLYFIKLYFHVLYAAIFIFLLLILHTFLEPNKSLAVTVDPDVSNCAVGSN